MAESISDQMREILDEYSDKVKEVTDEAINRVSKECVNKLHNSSPDRTGDYARGWAVKKIAVRNKISDVVVHNRTRYNLTHLLEFGHVVRNAKGTFGRAPAHPHIGPVDEWVADETEKRIKEKIEG